MEGGAHPWWCARAHHCTARLGGEHVSEQEILRLHPGSIYVRRYARHGRSGGHVEIRIVIPVPGPDGPDTQARLRRLAAGVWRVVQAYLRG